MSHDLTNNASNEQNPNQKVPYQQEQRSDDKAQHPSGASLPKRGHSANQKQRSRGRRTNNTGSQQANSQGGLQHAASSLVPTFRQGRWVKESIAMEHSVIAERIAKQMELIARRQNHHTGIKAEKNLDVFRFGMYAMQALASHELVAFDPGTIRVPQIFMLFWAQVRPMHDSERMVQVDFEIPNHVLFDDNGRYNGFLKHSEDATALFAKERMGEKLSKEEVDIVDKVREFQELDSTNDERYYVYVTTQDVREYIDNELQLYFETCYGLPAHVPNSSSEIFHISVDASGHLVSVPSVIPTGTALAIRAAFQFIELNKLFGPHNFANVHTDSFEDWIRSHVTLNMMNVRPDTYHG